MSEATAEAPDVVVGKIETVAAVPIETQSVIGFSEHVQIAKAHPRSRDAFVRDLRDEVTFSTEAAEKCTYALPFTDDKGDPIMGPSARFAECVYRCYGNLLLQSVAGEVRAKTLSAHAMAWDMERVNGLRVEVTRKITNRGGTRYPDHLIVTTMMAAQSIARRNVMLASAESHLWTPIWKEAQKLVQGTGQDTITRSRAEMKVWKNEYGFGELEVAALVKREGLADLTGRDLLLIRAFRQAIIDGDMAVDALRKRAGPEAASNDYLEELIAKQKAAEAEGGDDG